jgi:soluble lytic murein transglycosylase-like protein
MISARRPPPPLPVPPHIATVLDAAAITARVEPGLVRAIACVESSFNPRAEGPTTPKGWTAKGLMQLGPDLLRGIPDPYDPAANALAGARMLASMLKKYGNLEAAIAAYNFGPGNLDRHAGIPPPATLAYVAKVMARLEYERSSVATRPIIRPAATLSDASQGVLPTRTEKCPGCGVVLCVSTDLKLAVKS